MQLIEYIMHYINFFLIFLLGVPCGNGFFRKGFRVTRQTQTLSAKKHYPFSNKYFENYLRRLNSPNNTVQDNAILEKESTQIYTIEDVPTYFKNHPEIKTFDDYKKKLEEEYPQLFNITFRNQDSNDIPIFGLEIEEEDSDEEDVNIPEAFHKAMKEQKLPQKVKDAYFERFHRPTDTSSESDSSDNFHIEKNVTQRFTDVGGYDLVKEEMMQCADILLRYQNYAKYNVRIPKGLILEGPPGNGKTLLAKAFAGECGTNFISVSGSEFQEKYVGIGSSRVKELFELAKQNQPCIIFIDEIDALGRKRSSDGESSSAERDNTLNQLLVCMDGFQNSDGTFIIGASNRADLLDPALLRPGRIDKRIFISLPDSNTREAIINIHLTGKPHDNSINIPDLVDLTTGMSAAQIENILNEAMLHAIRNEQTFFTYKNIDVVMNRILGGWQPTEHQFTSEMIDQIIVHELGHAMVGLLAKQHSKMMKIVINLSSPSTPGYTVFEGSTSALYTRESLFEHLMILVAGRIAEEVFYNVSVTTGAINDFEEALKLAEKMVVYYGMGSSPIYPSNSEKYKEQIDNEVVQLIEDAYRVSDFIVHNCKEVIAECSVVLKQDRILRREELMKLIHEKYPEIMTLYVGTKEDMK